MENEYFDKFYAIYKDARIKWNLRMQHHEDIYGENWIKIYRYVGEQRVETIAKADGDSREEIYKRAYEELKSWLEKKR